MNCNQVLILENEVGEADAAAMLRATASAIFDAVQAGDLTTALLARERQIQHMFNIAEAKVGKI